MVDGGVDTLPSGLPALTLGKQVIRHASKWLVQPNGPKAGKLWTPTLRQARFWLWWYAVDEEGRWLFDHGVRRLAKGSGKSPFAGAHAIEELVGPVRLNFDVFDGTQESIDRLDRNGDPLGCKPVDMPLVQIAATAESQTANTMRMVRAMAQKRSRIVAEYHIDVGKTVFYTPGGGQLEVITSSAAAAEGAEVTFAVEDETEHWTPASGGQELAQTLDRNLGKSSSRAIETANAWVPGAGTVAETTYDAWVLQQEGATRGEAATLYDAVIAPPTTDLRDEESLRAAVAFVYEDCFWMDQRTICNKVWDPRTPPDVARRFYLNQPTAAQDAWTTPMAWAALTDVTRVVADGEPVVLFFDGSKSRDATALIGCCMSDGHVFTVDVWEPDPSHDADDTIDAAAVDSAVARAFERWDVVAFFADVREWESFVKVSWPAAYADRLLVMASPSSREPAWIAWDMRSHIYEFGEACETCDAEITEKAFRHDGDSRVARHVANARRRPRNGRVGIGKESPDSPKKIDAAVCVVGARMVRRIVLNSKQWQKRVAHVAGRGRVIGLA